MFSEAVDECVELSKKLNLRDSHIIRYMNATLRECQTKEYFYRDRQELTIPITTDASFIWDRPVRIRNIEAVQYPYSEGYSYETPLYIPRKTPGRIKEEDIYYYYGGPNYFVFNGVSNNTTIRLSAFYYCRTFKYYEDPATRPAVFNRETELWTYPTGATSAAEKEAARDLVSHWLFEDWAEMLKQGCLAKTYKDVEDVRAPATFAMYSGLLKVFQASEPKEVMAL